MGEVGTWAAGGDIRVGPLHGGGENPRAAITLPFLSTKRQPLPLAKNVLYPRSSHDMSKCVSDGSTFLARSSSCLSSPETLSQFGG